MPGSFAKLRRVAYNIVVETNALSTMIKSGHACVFPKLQFFTSEQYFLE